MGARVGWAVRDEGTVPCEAWRKRALRPDGPPSAAQALVRMYFRIYIYGVRISYDPAKRDWTLVQRGLDFEDAALVFAGLTAEVEDKRKDYGEARMICFGPLQNRLVVVGYTQRGAVRHVFSMRKANDREKARFAASLGL